MKVFRHHVCDAQGRPYAFSPCQTLRSELTQVSAVTAQFSGVMSAYEGAADGWSPRMSQPFMFSPTATFIGLTPLIDAFGFDVASKIALHYKPFIESTSAFKQTRLHTLSELTDTRPDLLGAMYLPADQFMTDPVMHDLMRAAGYDGAVYAANNQPTAIFLDASSDAELSITDDVLVDATPEGVHQAFAARQAIANESIRQHALGSAELLDWVRRDAYARGHAVLTIKTYLARGGTTDISCATRSGHVVLQMANDALGMVAIKTPSTFDGELTKPMFGTSRAEHFMQIIDACDRRVMPLKRPCVILDDALPVEKKPSATPDVGWLSVAEVQAEVRALGLGSLLDNETLVVYRASEDLPNTLTHKMGVMGAFSEDGKLHLVAGAMTRRKGIMGTLLHEGFHGAVPAHLGEQSWARLFDEIGVIYQSIRDGQEPSGYWADAVRSIDKLLEQEPNMPWSLQVEEFAAYAITHRVERPAVLTAWATSVVGFAKAWLRETFKVQLGRVTPDQLLHLSSRALSAVADSGARLIAHASTPFFAKDYATRRANQAPVDIAPRSHALVPVECLSRQQQRLLAAMSDSDVAHQEYVVMTHINPQAIMSSVPPRVQVAESEPATEIVVAHGHVVLGFNELQRQRKNAHCVVVNADELLSPEKAAIHSQWALDGLVSTRLRVSVEPHNEALSIRSTVADALTALAVELDSGRLTPDRFPYAADMGHASVLLDVLHPEQAKRPVPTGQVAVTLTLGEQALSTFDAHDVATSLGRAATHALDVGLGWRADDEKRAVYSLDSQAGVALATFQSRAVLSPVAVNELTWAACADDMGQTPAYGFAP